jgi:hypothetical protein
MSRGPRPMEYIKLEDCIKGNVYKIRSRNLTLGVFDGEMGFIGIRTKFGDRYLFTEYHWDTGAENCGTTHPIEDLGPLSEFGYNYHKILIQQRWPDRCTWCGFPTIFVQTPGLQTGKVYHLNIEDTITICENPETCTLENKQLFWALEAIQKDLKLEP